MVEIAILPSFEEVKKVEWVLCKECYYERDRKRI